MAQFTVKEEFLNECPEPEKADIEDLAGTFKFTMFLHNEMGPAIDYSAGSMPKEVQLGINTNIRIKNSKAYWLNGNLVFPHEWEKATGHKILDDGQIFHMFKSNKE